MKICFWADTEWAFGQIHNAVAKYSRYSIDLLSWSNSYDAGTLDSYDVICVPTPKCHFNFCNRHENLRHKTICIIHGKAELWNYDIGTKYNVRITSDVVDSNVIPKSMIAYLNSLPLVGCVSKELCDLLQANLDVPVCLVKCGVDKNVFHNDNVRNNDVLSVLCTMPHSFIGKIQHGYDVKRLGIVAKLQQLMPEVNFVFTPSLLSNSVMREFYSTGDIILCTSHSEGNPLTLMEAGAMGLLPITTNVGIVPEVFTHNHDSFIIRSTDSDSIVNQFIHYIQLVHNNRTKLMIMKKNVRTNILDSRLYNTIIDTWDNLFTLMEGR